MLAASALPLSQSPRAPGSRSIDPSSKRELPSSPVHSRTQRITRYVRHCAPRSFLEREGVVYRLTRDSTPSPSNQLHPFQTRMPVLADDDVVVHGNAERGGD